MRRQSREYEQRWKMRQNLLEQAKIDLNFQSPETVLHLVHPVERPSLTRQSLPDRSGAGSRGSRR